MTEAEIIAHIDRFIAVCEFRVDLFTHRRNMARNRHGWSSAIAESLDGQVFEATNALDRAQDLRKDIQSAIDADHAATINRNDR